MRGVATRWAVGATLCAVGFTAGCASEPRGEMRESERDTILISINDERYQQQAFGEVITGAFVRSGREAYLETERNSMDKPRISRLESGQVDLVVGCTGEFLHYLDPALAEKLSKEYLADKAKGLDPNDGTWRDKVYQAMVGSLPSTLMATDPSNAQGCDNYEGPELPQNVVPVFRETALSRDDRGILNKVTGGISTKDLDTLFDGDQRREATHSRAEALLNKLTF
ncbi:hypothetical protein CKALI_07570 [Corynebacterium kalinowskii]|uniref:Uncharacterized protein n=1 Tax=Corynebacterium kalinowskii TaxID=2675216 RepID=A0A6B8VUE5_9CORY|nr:hypothetical protein [Corynebacterium kalinowskii]QGU02376.1 hypothetical protein CKALI_07570 [Corynebacterium kalinowskii]